MYVFTVPDVTRKVRHLRTYYARLLRENSKKKLRRGKRWQFFDQMEFLHDHIILRMTRPICNVRIHFNVIVLAHTCSVESMLSLYDCLMTVFCLNVQVLN